jgi:hypothetical protein
MGFKKGGVVVDHNREHDEGGRISIGFVRMWACKVKCNKTRLVAFDAASSPLKSVKLKDGFGFVKEKLGPMANDINFPLARPKMPPPGGTVKKPAPLMNRQGCCLTIPYNFQEDEHLNLESAHTFGQARTGVHSTALVNKFVPDQGKKWIECAGKDGEACVHGSEEDADGEASEMHRASYAFIKKVGKKEWRCKGCT